MKGKLGDKCRNGGRNAGTGCSELTSFTASTEQRGPTWSRARFQTLKICPTVTYFLQPKLLQIVLPTGDQVSWHWQRLWEDISHLNYHNKGRGRSLKLDLQNYYGLSDFSKVTFQFLDLFERLQECMSIRGWENSVQHQEHPGCQLDCIWN